MAETLGMLCDKLTIVKLKQYHCEDEQKLSSLNNQQIDLITEIDVYILNAHCGKIPISKIKSESNKVYKEEGNEMRYFEGNIGSLISQLASVNCDLWHEQEKVFEFETVPNEDKNNVIKKLAILNLERNQCIDKINEELYKIISSRNEN
jgi:hypothetical protein